jgi:aldose 1-epimerase
VKPNVQARPFGALSDGVPVTAYTLDNGAGMRLEVLDYGCIIRRWTLERAGASPVNLVLSLDSLSDYERDQAYFGALVGRFANRIDHGRFELSGQHHQLTRNEGEHHLHGGAQGFHKQTWQAHAGADHDAAWINLFRLSPDGEERYPGDLLAMISYLLSANGELRCRYQAVSDRPTLFSASQHSYFNLAGTGDILDHELQIAADSYLPVRADLIPTGERAPVEGTPFDFRRARRIGDGLAAAHPQLALARGYDHNFVLAGTAGPHAVLSDPASGRRMAIYTDCPGLQFYSGNYLDGSLSGQGREFGRHAGLCLEPQQFPDTPNRPDFPQRVCRPGWAGSMATLYALSNWR